MNSHHVRMVIGPRAAFAALPVDHRKRCDKAWVHLEGHDAFGRLQAVTMFAQMPAAVTDLSQAGLDALVAPMSNDAKNRTMQFVYDLTGRVRMTQDAQGGRAFDFYDTFGELRFQVRRGRTAGHGPGSLDRPGPPGQGNGVSYLALPDQSRTLT